MKLLFYCLLLLVFCKSQAQTSLYDSLNYRHDKISRTGLKLLSAWSLASLTSGVVGQNNSVGAEKYFHKRNVLWGGVNFGLSGLSLLRIRADRNKTYTSSQTIKRLQAAQRLFLFNTGLDLAYASFGLYTRERATKFSGDKADRLKGTGNSLLLQGGFLTLFDAVLYALHHNNGERLDRIFENLSLISSPNGLGLVYCFR